MDKARGAFYTETRVAEALCNWALRQPGERALDPAFGGGVFLDAAARRLAELGGGEVHGVEIDPATFATAAPDADSPGRLLEADFFDVSPADFAHVDAVVGNPPFIRFQRFGRERRSQARARALEAGISVGPLAGSWVAFVAHATSFLKPGGRLALVVPAELGHAPYARPLLELLRLRFATTTVVAFRNSLFPHLDQETMLLLADCHGAGPGRFSALELAGPEELASPLPPCGAIELDAAGLVSGSTSLARELLDPVVREIYDGLSEDRVARLGDVATVESGYVTGANAHFHASTEAARAAGLPAEVLVPALFRSRALAGLHFLSSDWANSALEGSAGYLIQALGREDEPAVARFLDRLRAEGIHLRYKARTRSPWFRIPRVGTPPLVLAAMGGARLALAVNDARAAIPNTFHSVTPHPGAPGPAQLAAAWLSSLTALSCELEGHTLGGGLLKLDPGEAGEILLVAPAPLRSQALDRIDALLRAGEASAARCETDRLLLSDRLGMSGNDVARLGEAAEQLIARRQRRSKVGDHKA
jgi:adenine-specific DNA-methyltransferase